MRYENVRALLSLPALEPLHQKLMRAIEGANFCLREILIFYFKIIALNIDSSSGHHFLFMPIPEIRRRQRRPGASFAAFACDRWAAKMP